MAGNEPGTWIDQAVADAQQESRDRGHHEIRNAGIDKMKRDIKINTMLAMRFQQQLAGAPTSINASTLPFGVIVQPKPASSNSYQLGVYYDSLIFKSRNLPGGLLDTAAITGLFTQLVPTSTDSGWKTMLAGSSSSAPDVVWIETAGDPVGGVATYKIKSLGNGDSYGGGSAEHDGGMSVGGNTIYTQKYGRVPIAIAWFASNGPDANPQVYQIVDGHRLMKIFPQNAQYSDGTNTQLINTIMAEDY
jgi:hypothetical protein